MRVSSSKVQKTNKFSLRNRLQVESHLFTFLNGRVSHVTMTTYEQNSHTRPQHMFHPRRPKKNNKKRKSIRKRCKKKGRLNGHEKTLAARCGPNKWRPETNYSSASSLISSQQQQQQMEQVEILLDRHPLGGFCLVGNTFSSSTFNADTSATRRPNGRQLNQRPLHFV